MVIQISLSVFQSLRRGMDRRVPNSTVQLFTTSAIHSITNMAFHQTTSQEG